MKLDFKNRFDSELGKFPFVIVDVGALGGPKKEWAPLKKHLKLIGFEPSEEGYRALKEKKIADVIYFNSACYHEKQKITLHITEHEGSSSTFMPNHDFLNHFPENNINGYRLKNSVTVNADRMDNMLDPDLRRSIDFMKVDAEGSAFEVIKGAKKILQEGLVVGLKIEAEFNEKYKNQNLFSDLDRLLREHKYQLFNVDACYWKRRVGTKTAGTRGQLVHGDFLYFIDSKEFFAKLKDYSKDAAEAKAIKFIMLSYLYGYFDFSMELLCESFKREVLDGRHYEVMKKELRKTSNFLMRIPKLKGRGVIFDLLYHGYMTLFGVWLEHSNFYNPKLEL